MKRRGDNNDDSFNLLLFFLQAGVFLALCGVILHNIFRA